MNKLINKISFIFILSIGIFSLVGCNSSSIPEIVTNTPGYEKWETVIDYSDSNNWLSLPTNIDKSVDVIYFYPTCYTPASGSNEVISDIRDAGMIQGAQNCLLTQASVFNESCNIFAPLYRQISGTYALTISNEDNENLFRYASSKDASNALDYYFNNLNNGRPFILAGHSQGSETSLFLLSDYFKEHSKYLNKMVAAYIIGYSVTSSFLEENTHLKFATSSSDTGVIVSWNTEGPNNVDKHNAVVLDGAISINPLNWKRDETYASTSENLGSLINGQIVNGVADAKVNINRGTVITNADTLYAIGAAMSSIFGPECFHGYDYGFYYNNIKENVATRIASFLNR